MDIFSKIGYALGYIIAWPQGIIDGIIGAIFYKK